MITTISLNPSIDRTVEVERFVPGGLNRVVESNSVAAGKGVNGRARGIGAGRGCGVHWIYVQRGRKAV